MKILKRCLIFSLFLIPFFFFYSTLLLFSSQWAVKFFTAYYLHEKIVYQEARLEGNQLILIQPCFEQGERFKAEKMIFTCTFNKAKKELNLALQIDKLHWTPNPAQLNWEEMKRFFESKSVFIRINPSLTIQDGVISWPMSEQTLSPIRFSLKGDRRAGGMLSVYLDESNPANNQLTIQAFNRSKVLTLNWDCQSVQCQKLMSVATLLFPQLQSWHFTSGVLHGQLQAIFPAKKKPRLEGQFSLLNAHFHQEGSPLKGEVEELRVKVTGPSNETQKGLFEGSIEIVKPGVLTYAEGDKEYWKLDQVKGKISLDGARQALVQLDAEGHVQQHCSHFNLDGQWQDDHPERPFHLDINFTCHSIDQPQSQITLALYPQASFQLAEIKCSKLSSIECELFQTLLASYWPDLKQVELKEGIFNGLIQIELSKKGMNQVQFKDWEIEQLRFIYAPWKATFYFPYWKGDGVLDASAEDAWSTTYANLHIEEGQIQFEGLYPFTHLATHLKIEKGCIDRSLVQLQWMDLKGHLDIEWNQHRELLQLHLHGQLLDLASRLPVRFQSIIVQHFSHYPLEIFAELKRKNGELEMEGLISLQDLTLETAPHFIYFGGGFKKFLSPVGWFNSSELPLETFISPFLFPTSSLQLTGLTHLKGSFSSEEIFIEYEAKRAVLENEDLLIELKPAGLAPIVGTHRIDLITFTHQGCLPIRNGFYIEKSHQLLFSDIQGDVLFKDQKMIMPSLETYCQGIYLNGSLCVDYSHPIPNIFNLTCHFPIFHGSLDHMKQVFTQLDSSINWHHFPLKGEIEGREQGIYFAIDFEPTDFHIAQAQMQGVLTQGTMPISGSHLSLQDLYADIQYEQTKKELKLTEIQGSVVLRKGEEAEEYQLAGSYVSIQPKYMTGDIWINSGMHQICRLCLDLDQQDVGIDCQLDLAKSHFSGMYPHYFSLKLKDWETVDFCHIRAEFPLEAIFKDMQLFLRTGLFFPEELQKNLSHIYLARGDCQLEIDYDSHLNRLDYHLKAQHLNWNDSVFNAFNFQGKKQEKTWLIDQLQLDQWSLAAEIQNRQDQWKVDFLGLSDGQSFLMGLEGVLNPAEKCLKGKVNLFEANLTQLSQWEALQAIKEYAVGGQIKGAEGAIQLTLLNQAPWLKVEAALQLRGQEITIRDYPLFLTQPFSLEVSSKSLLLSHLSCKLEQQSQVVIEKICYNWEQKTWECPFISVSIPSYELKPLANRLHASFPEVCDEKTRKILATCRTEGSLEAVLAFEQKNGYSTFSAQLNDGLYYFKKRPYDVKNLHVHVDQNLFTFSLATYEERCPFVIEGYAEWPLLEKGGVTLRDKTSVQPLSIAWTDDPKEGFKVEAIEGEFAGLQIHLKQTPQLERQFGWSWLHGRVDVDFNSVCSLLSSDVAETISGLDLGPLYTIEGNWHVNSEEGLKFLDMVHFQGKLYGRNAIVKGYQVDKLEADLFYAPYRLDVQQFSIEDSSGQVTCAECAVVRQEEKKWMLVIPRLIVKNFRPSLLREPASITPSQFKTLLIRRIVLNDFYGELDHVSTWRATGVLNFLNSARKHFSHPIFTIPAELILRIGLNPDVLNPVTGTIFFNLQGDRFTLDKFKDVFSEGRGSKFYLAKGNSSSWMDFNGNLSVHIRMKQYNLLFKIAELFTVSIQGNIKKPKYNLQKQEK